MEHLQHTQSSCCLDSGDKVTSSTSLSSSWWGDFIFRT